MLPLLAQDHSQSFFPGSRHFRRNFWDEELPQELEKVEFSARARTSDSSRVDFRRLKDICSEFFDPGIGCIGAGCFCFGRREIAEDAVRARR